MDSALFFPPQAVSILQTPVMAQAQGFRGMRSPNITCQISPAKDNNEEPHGKSPTKPK